MAAQKKISVTVKREFRDKNTKKLHRVGDVLSITQRRYDEIVGKDPTLVSVTAD